MYDVDCSSLVVERETSGENSRLDIRLMDPIRHFNCIIENKIFSGEGEDQTFRLYKNFSGICPKELFVFLTLDEEAVPQDKHFISITYKELLPIFSRLSDASTGDAKLLIKNYLTTLRGLMMSSKFNGYSEKTQLYFKYFEQIHDVNSSFNQDRKLLLLALKERIIGSKWWSSSWEMKQTDSQISIWKTSWFKDKSGVYFQLYPSTERPAFFLLVYGEQSPFSSKYVKNLEEQYKLRNVNADNEGFVSHFDGQNTFFEKLMVFSFSETNQVTKIIDSLNKMVNLFEGLIDASIQKYWMSH